MSVQTNNIFKRAALALAGGLAGLVVMAAVPVAASALERPDPCYVEHDHRSHQADYYTYYEADRFSRAGPYRSGGSFSITIGSRGADYDRGRRNDYRRDHDRRSGYDKRNRRTGYYDNSRRSDRGNRSRVVKRDVFRTRYNARIVLTEEVIRGRRGDRLLCTVSVRGREAGYVSRRKVNRVAYRNCSRNARINIIA